MHVVLRIGKGKSRCIKLKLLSLPQGRDSEQGNCGSMKLLSQGKNIIKASLASCYFLVFVLL